MNRSRRDAAYKYTYARATGTGAEASQQQSALWLSAARLLGSLRARTNLPCPYTARCLSRSLRHITTTLEMPLDQLSHSASILLKSQTASLLRCNADVIAAVTSETQQRRRRRRWSVAQTESAEREAASVQKNYTRQSTCFIYSR